VARYKRYPPEVDMTITKSEVALLVIAVALVVAVLFGFNITE
jgi:hypothetical protein